MPLIPDTMSINQRALARTRRTLSVATLFRELYSTDKVEVEGPKSWTFFGPGVWTGKKPIRRPGSTLCASLCSRNAHGQVTRAILCGKLGEKCRTPIPGPAFCVSLRSRKAHGHLRRAIWCGNLWENAGYPKNHLGSNTYRKNPLVWPHCLGKSVTRQSSKLGKKEYLQRRHLTCGGKHNRLSRAEQHVPTRLCPVLGSGSKYASKIHVRIE